MRLFKYALLLALISFYTLSFGQGTQVEFGKNRVQYHDDFTEWNQYESYNFITYWYGKGRYIGQTVVQMAELDFEEIQSMLEHRMNDKIEIVVYTDITDMKQTNIGSEEAFVNTGGQTKIVGNKMFVYFDGNHNNLRYQIREGIATVYLNSMLFGSNLQEIVQNAVMLNLPDWFKMGLVSYVGESWNTELDNKLRDALQSREYKDFDDFAADYPRLAGHSLWYYISQNFGKSTVSNLLYLTRINRSIESGFLYVLGGTYRKTTENWMTYFKQRYEEEVKGMADLEESARLPIKNKRKLPITKAQLSPDGKTLVYITNEISKFKIYLYDLETGKQELLMKQGFRNAFQATDYNYPLLAWKPNGQELSIVYENRDIIKLLTYNINTKEEISEDLDPQYDRIFSVDYFSVTNMVFSAQVRGVSDLFIYYTLTRQTERITNDFYDDLDAKVVNVRGQKGVLFASNRKEAKIETLKLDTILPLNNFDIFYYNLEEKSKDLVRVTNTPYANERQPISIDTTYFAYLSNESGIRNRKMGYLEDVFQYNEQVITLKDGGEIRLHEDSSLAKLDTAAIDSIRLEPLYETMAFTHNTTNYKRDIIHQFDSWRTNKMAEVIYNNENYHIYIKTADPSQKVNAKLTKFQQQQLKTIGNTLSADNGSNKTITDANSGNKPVAGNKPSAKQKTEKKKNDYLFQSEFDDFEFPERGKEEEKKTVDKQEEIVSEIRVEETDEPKVMKFRPARITPYRLKFRTDFVTTQMDNSLLFGGLDTYAGTGDEQYNYPPPGILLKGNFKDLFEDYEFEGGIRVPVSFNGAEYFLTFHDKKKRLDKKYAFYRRNLRNTDNSNLLLSRRTETTTLLGQYQLRWPLDIYRSIRGTFTLRNDRTTQLATDANPIGGGRTPLDKPTENEQRIGFRLEYVFDNTLDVSINIKNGTRYKVYAEVVKRFQFELINNFNLSFNEGFMTILGADARHYQRLDKHSILALRVAGATSFGSERILYYLGGVDNWLFPKFNENIPQPQSDEFAYQTLAANMRGFRQNIRNGSSYALANAELRVPFIRYLTRRPIRNSFLRNLQAVGFFDVGTAWQGLTPFSSDNPLNIVTISNPTVSVKVNYFRDPIVAGYGAGLRTVLFGYFIRIDHAWGLETRQVGDGRWYFSLGLDF